MVEHCCLDPFVLLDEKLQQLLVVGHKEETCPRHICVMFMLWADNP